MTKRLCFEESIHLLESSGYDFAPNDVIVGKRNTADVLMITYK